MRDARRRLRRLAHGPGRASPATARTAFLQRVLSNDLDRLRAAPGAVHAAAQRARRHRRRPDRLPRGADALAARRQRLATSTADVAHLAGAAPGAASSSTTAPTDYGMVALQGPTRSSVLAALRDAGGEAAAATASSVRHGGRRASAGVQCLVARTGYTGEPGVELIAAAGRHRAALGRAARSARARRRALRPRARATRCGSRSATRCTATTSRPRRTRSRPGSAGSARSTRSSPARARCGAQGRAGPERRLVGLAHEAERAIPRAGYPICSTTATRVGTVTSGTLLADARQRHRPGLRSARARRRPARRSQVDIRGRDARRRVVASKPLYRKEQ